MRTMADHAALLRLLTWLSPAFPTGAYAYSHGLEWSVAVGDVTDGASLRDWIEDLLACGSARSDAILLRHAHRAARAADSAGSDNPAGWFPPFSSIPSRKGRGIERAVSNPALAGVDRGEGTARTVAEIAELAAAVAPARERQAETLGPGAAFAAAAAVWDAIPSAPYPVAVGVLTGRSGIAEDDAVAAYLQAFAANLVSAGVRLIPLGQSAGLAVLATLEPTILATTRGTRESTLDDIGSACWRSDIAAMRHETQYTRLFRT
ncbi:MAG: urease accessory protein UreF [Alphaproteobacteria bacterium]|nr:urease accessory protein UreF [Alphaproteobacteria bacterium]